MTGKNRKSYFTRGLAVVAGILMIGIAVGFFKIVALGADPYTAMNTGISSAVSMQFGTLQLIINGLIQFFRVHWSDKLLAPFHGE